LKLIFCFWTKHDEFSLFYLQSQMQVQTFAYQPNVVLDGSGPLSRIQRVHEKMGNCLAWRFTTAAQ